MNEWPAATVAGHFFANLFKQTFGKLEKQNNFAVCPLKK